MLLQRGLLVHPEEFTPELPDEFRRAGLNVLGLHPVGGGHAAHSLAAAIGEFPTPDFQSKLRRAEALGLKVEYHAHALRWLLPERLFPEKPDWFRMNEAGERTPDANLCVSNGEALNFLTERSALLAELLPTKGPRFYYWPDDASACACRCPECRRLPAADQQLRIANAILRGLRRRRPDAKLSFLAYYDSLELPRLTEPEEGIFLEFAPYRRDHHAPLFDARVPENVSQTRFLPELIAFFGKKDAVALDYWMDNSLFSAYTKPPKALRLDEAVLAADAEGYDRLGFETVLAFGCYLGPDYRALYGPPPVEAFGRILSRFA